ncbi:MAG TPA: DUF2058 domain-containing protein [Steroidobacteraceae bacterium]|nr:DUF2058 domain-containing protein [Steroidobacteraceae bacterium]
MSSSLRDQLIAAGLVTERQAKQAKQEQARQFKQRKLPDNAAKAAAERAQAAKAARDQELAQRQQEKAERKARRAQVNQMVEQVALPKVESDDSYSFVDGTTIRRIPITAELRNRLTAGELAIVRFRGHYALVPSEAVPRIRERDERAVIALDKGDRTTDPNDPYKDFVVPDDLTW